MVLLNGSGARSPIKSCYLLKNIMASTPDLIHASGISPQTSTCKTTSPAPRQSWQQLFKSDNEAISYQHSTWLDCMCETGKYEDVSRLYETSKGRQFLLPLVRRKGFPQ